MCGILSLWETRKNALILRTQHTAYLLYDSVCVRVHVCFCVCVSVRQSLRKSDPEHPEHSVFCNGFTLTGHFGRYTVHLLFFLTQTAIQPTCLANAQSAYYHC